MCGCLGLWEERDKEWAELAEREREERGGRGGITAWGRRQTGREGTGSEAEASGGDFAEIPLSFGAAGAQERDGDGSDLALTCLFALALRCIFHMWVCLCSGIFISACVCCCILYLHLHMGACTSAGAGGGERRLRGVPAPPRCALRFGKSLSRAFTGQVSAYTQQFLKSADRSITAISPSADQTQYTSIIHSHDRQTDRQAVA